MLARSQSATSASANPFFGLSKQIKKAPSGAFLLIESNNNKFRYDKIFGQQKNVFKQGLSYAMVSQRYHGCDRQ